VAWRGDEGGTFLVFLFVCAALTLAVSLPARVCCPNTAHSYLRHPLAESEVHALVGEAVELEQEFICEALSVSLDVGVGVPVQRQAGAVTGWSKDSRGCVCLLTLLRCCRVLLPPHETTQVAVVGMNAGLMAQYIQFVADRLLLSLGYKKLYNATNPFDWMELISLQVCWVCMCVSGWD
jgi:hypothetical protein